MLWDKYQSLPESDQLKQLVTAKAPIRLKMRLSWRKLATERMEKLDIKRDVTTDHLPPWRQLNNLTIDKVSLNKPKEEYTEGELFKISMQKIEHIQSNVRIFTDGSTGGGETNGGEGVHIECSRAGRILQRASYPAGKMCSSYTGECVALVEALKWLLENPQTSLICSDSLSLHGALLSNKWKDNGSRSSRKMFTEAHHRSHFSGSHLNVDLKAMNLWLNSSMKEPKCAKMIFQ